jgi:tetratricopeptide (TPR) repeat protein
MEIGRPLHKEIPVETFLKINPMNIRTGIVSFAWAAPFMVTLSTVFVVAPGMENGVVSGKYAWFYLSMAVAAIVSACIAMTSRKPKPFQINVADGLILLYGLVSLSVSYWLNHSESVTKHILLTLVILLYFCFKILFHYNRQTLYWIILFFLVTGLVESLWGLRQLYGFEHSQHARFRLTGSFFNPGPYACYIAMVLPCAFYYVLRHRACMHINFRFRYGFIYLRWGIALLTCTGALLVLPATMSRTSWLAGAGGCAWVCIQYLFKNKKANTFYHTHKKQCMLLISCLLVFVVLGSVGIYHLKKDSADGRLLMWEVSLQTLIRHPEGVGIGYFSGSYGYEQAAYFESGKGTEREEYVAGNPEYGFNEYLQMGIEQGIGSLILFLLVAGYSLYAGFRKKRVAATASLLALLTVAMMSYPFSVLPFLIVMSFLLAWIHTGEDESKGIPLCRPITFGLALCCLLLALGCLYNRYPVRQAYEQWSKCKMLYHSGAYERASEEYALLYPLLADQLPFLFEYGQSLSKSERYEESNEILLKAIRIGCDPMLYNILGKNHQAMKRYADAERYFLKAAHIVPNRIYPWYLLTKLYVETGETEKAGHAANIVLTRKPKVDSTAIKEMRDEIRILIF